MPYRFLDDIAIADVAFKAWGKDLEEMFVTAADATAEVMVERIDKIEPVQRRTINLEDERLDMLLFQLLQEMIFYKDSESVILRVTTVKIEQQDGTYFLTAEARGEILDAEKHEPNVDVKAVTLHNLKVEKTRNGWEATVVLDV